jgi:F0F1-type ATP synthase membrane subunit a
MLRCLKQNWVLGVLVLLAAARFAAFQAPPAAAQDPGHDHKVAAKDKSTKHDAKHDDHAGHHEPNALEHTMDSEEFHLFTILSPHAIPLPPGVTKFMVLELIAALLVLAVYIPLARRMQTGEPPRGAWDNFFEVLLTFVRDQVAKPSIGDNADRYVPFLWTMFLFVLFNNLLGMVPFMGSATSNIYATAGLALVVFFAIHGSAIVKMAHEDPHAHHGEHGHDHGDGHGHG